MINNLRNAHLDLNSQNTMAVGLQLSYPQVQKAPEQDSFSIEKTPKTYTKIHN